MANQFKDKGYMKTTFTWWQHDCPCHQRTWWRKSQAPRTQTLSPSL